MGFFIMLASFLLGLFLIAYAWTGRQGGKKWLVFPGIILVLFAIWLGFPK